jgi:hypothetical protein
MEVAAAATEELKLFFHTPPATFRALKAALFMLGNDVAQFDSWAKARTFVSPQLFSALSAFDATADRVMPHWKGVRACMKGLTAASLQGEAVLGDLLRVYVLHTKAVANAWTAQRAAANGLAEAAEAAAAEQVSAGVGSSV